MDGALRCVTVRQKAHASQPVRGDTRSGRAMHTNLHSEVPRLSSILSVNSWMGRLVVGGGGQSAHWAQPATPGSSVWEGGETVWSRRAHEVATGSRPGLSGTQRTSFGDRCSTRVWEETRMQSRPGNAPARPGPPLLQKKKVSLGSPRACNPSRSVAALVLPTLRLHSSGFPLYGAR